MLLSAPKFFKLKETDPGTVLVERGVFQKSEPSKKYPASLQHFFLDLADNKLKCLSGGQLGYLIDMHDIDKTKEVKITYAGEETIENGTHKGTNAHQFDIDLIADNSVQAAQAVQTEMDVEAASGSLDNLE